MATTAIMSGLEFDALPCEESRRWELLEGELIEVSSPTPRHQMIVRRIQRLLEDYLSDGLVLADLEFALAPSVRLRPDVCVLLADKTRQLDTERSPVPGAPDIAIEVISPTERATTSHEKARTYLRCGTQEVWQVYPKSRTVQIHRGATASSLDADGQITSGLLPGFAVPVSSFSE
jgi:Uma2 family endonuclease